MIPLLYRIHVEENALLAAVGDRYRTYASAHKRFADSARVVRLVVHGSGVIISISSGSGGRRDAEASGVRRHQGRDRRGAHGRVAIQLGRMGIARQFSCAGRGRHRDVGAQQGDSPVWSRRSKALTPLRGWATPDDYRRRRLVPGFGRARFVTGEDRCALDAGLARTRTCTRGQCDRARRQRRLSCASVMRRCSTALAEEYDRERPSYPPELIEAAIKRGALSAGDPVVEVGCGTVSCTAALIAARLPRRRGPARREDGSASPGAAWARAPRRGFHQRPVRRRRFASGAFAPVLLRRPRFTGSSRRSAGRARRVCSGRGACWRCCSTARSRTSEPRRTDALHAALGKVAPDIAARWPGVRDAATIASGATDRRDNISEVWSWMGRHELAVAQAARCSPMCISTPCPSTPR